MRTLALLPVVWSFVGVPTLCRAGFLVECCAPAAPLHTESHGNPDECPDKCPGHEPHECPDGTESPEPRDCGSCAEACNAVSPHQKTVANEELTSTPATTVATPRAYASRDASPSHALPDIFDGWPRKYLPYPVSDRPLLI